LNLIFDDDIQNLETPKFPKKISNSCLIFHCFLEKFGAR